jgi:hypothetical protein
MFPSCVLVTDAVVDPLIKQGRLPFTIEWELLEPVETRPDQ